MNTLYKWTGKFTYNHRHIKRTQLQYMLLVMALNNIPVDNKDAIEIPQQIHQQKENLINSFRTQFILIYEWCNAMLTMLYCRGQWALILSARLW